MRVEKESERGRERDGGRDGGRERGREGGREREGEREREERWAGTGILPVSLETGSRHAFMRMHARPRTQNTPSVPRQEKSSLYCARKKNLTGTRAAPRQEKRHVHCARKKKHTHTQPSTPTPRPGLAPCARARRRLGPLFRGWRGRSCPSSAGPAQRGPSPVGERRQALAGARGGGGWQRLGIRVWRAHRALSESSESRGRTGRCRSRGGRARRRRAGVWACRPATAAVLIILDVQRPPSSSYWTCNGRRPHHTRRARAGILIILDVQAPQKTSNGRPLRKSFHPLAQVLGRADLRARRADCIFLVDFFWFL